MFLVVSHFMFSDPDTDLLIAAVKHDYQHPPWSGDAHAPPHAPPHAAPAGEADINIVSLVHNAVLVLVTEDQELKR